MLRMSWVPFCLIACGPPATSSGGETSPPAKSPVSVVDADRDGFAADEDCDDTDAAVYPGAQEVGWDGIDQDCSGRDQYDFSQVCAGGEHTCGVDTTGQIRCWGADDARVQDAPTEAQAWRRLACGADETCALTEDGILTCWGLDELDKGFAGAAQAWRNVELGHHHGCVLDDAGFASCFGQDVEGAVSSVPTDVPLKEMALGDAHTCSLLGLNNLIDCWGQASVTDAVRSDPNPGTQVVVAGEGFVCALDPSGAECWGANPPTLPSDAFTQLAVKGQFACTVFEGAISCSGLEGAPTDDAWFVTAGLEHACAIRRADGEVVCWGENGAGQATVPDWSTED